VLAMVPRKWRTADDTEGGRRLARGLRRSFEGREWLCERPNATLGSAPSACPVARIWPGANKQRSRQMQTA
jgi:hypothetical protein